MSISYVAYSSSGARPSGTAHDDLILASIWAYGGAPGPYTGWTQIATRSLGYSYYVSYFYRVYQTGDTHPTWGGVFAETWTYRGVDTTSPIYDSAEAFATSSTATLTSLTSSSDAGDAAFYSSNGLNSGSHTVPTNYTERSDSGSDTSAGDRLGLTASQTTSGTLTTGGSTGNSCLHAILKVASTGYDIDAAGSSYALTGTAVNPEFGRLVDAGVESYLITGIAATLDLGSQTITGVTKDKTGAILGSCTVWLFKDNGTSATYVDTDVSNATTGVYEFTGVGDTDASYFVIVFKATGLVDATDHVLQPG